MPENIDYNYLDQLNPQQRDAVVYKDGPSLVIAGAGSGKTRVLTYKIVDLLRNGFEPYRILALTFTNKAAREMKERITNVVGENVASRIRMGTFHSVFLGILRRHAELIGFQPGFTIYDTSDSKSLVKMIVRDMGLDEKIYKPSAILSVISNSKNAMIGPDEYNNDPENFKADLNHKRPQTGNIFKAYCERCKISNAMDFDDILVYMNILLRDHPEIREQYRDFFRYILVDEYQDTNFAQHLIITLLANEKKRICVVGDDAQSIYSFRGANINNILTLENKLPGLKIFKLERNYRSTQNIIDAAGSLIKKNRRQMPKNVYSENDKGEKIEIYRTESDRDEATLIANLVNNSKLTRHDSYDEYAVLYRTNAQSRALEESLRKRNIPYRIYGGVSFYQRKEVKDMVSYFRLSINSNDDEALKRVINFPARGIGETTMKKLISAATESGKSLWEVITTSNLSELGLNKGTITKVNNFSNLIKEFIKDNENGSDAYGVARLIYNRTGILLLYTSDNTPESVSRKENLDELLNAVKSFVDIQNGTDNGPADMKTFLSEVMLATDQDENEADNQAKVTLMTVHAAKGLEFKHVYIVGMEEDLFPSLLSKDSEQGIEEERRLFYVAMTRAKSTCTITYASSRFRNGQTAATNPSSFLMDIDSCYLNRHDSGFEAFSNYGTKPYSYNKDSKSGHSGYKPWSPKTQQKDSKPETTRIPRENLHKLGAPLPNGPAPQHNASDLKEGMKILHDKFGQGTIVGFGNIAGESSITVDFGKTGIKRLILRFAKFEIL